MYKSLPFTMYTIPAFTIYISLRCKLLTTNDFRRPGCHNSLIISNLWNVLTYKAFASLSSLLFNYFIAQKTPLFGGSYHVSAEASSLKRNFFWSRRERNLNPVMALDKPSVIVYRLTI